MTIRFASIKQSLWDIFSKPRYSFFALCISGIIIIGMILLQNIPFIKTIIHSPSFSFVAKIRILFDSLRAFNTNLTHVSQFFHIVISLLIGVHITSIIYYYRTRRKFGANVGVGFIGVLSGILGIGCSVCGSVVLSSLIGLSATTVIVTTLPLHGIEFSLAAIIMLVWSIAYICIKLQDPIVCKK